MERNMNDYLVLIYVDGEICGAIPTRDEQQAQLFAVIAMHDKENERAEVYKRLEIEAGKVGYIRIGECLRREL